LCRATASAASSGERQRPRILPANWTFQTLRVLTNTTGPISVGYSNATPFPLMAAEATIDEGKKFSDKLSDRLSALIPGIGPCEFGRFGGGIIARCSPAIAPLMQSAGAL
jgi:hypothetical protein